MDQTILKILELDAATEERLSAARLQCRKQIEDARKQAREMLRNAQGTIDEISEELRSISKRRKNAGFNEGHIAGGAANSRRALKQAEAAYKSQEVRKPDTLQTGKAPEPEQIKLGMRVKYTKLDQTGEVESLPDSRGNLAIRLGAIKMTVNIRDLIIAESENAGHKEKNRAKFGSMSFGKTKTIKTEINLIGKNLDEATDLMLKYIDDAYLAGLKTVNVIHGRGEGILRNGLRAELKKNKHVKSFRSAPYNDGGEGCTIVELKERK